jgi:epoxyqueuosine reductase
VNKLSIELKEKLILKGATLVGYSELSDIPGAGRQGYDYGISIAIALAPQIISGIGNGPTQDYYDEYHRINSLLDELAIFTAKWIEDYGYKAFPQTLKNVVEDEKTWRTSLPHKTVATRSGIGWIGKSAMLVTEEYGSAIRFTSVLTNLELEVGKPITDSKCGNCTNCLEACPGNAIKGINWNVDMDRDQFFNPFDCRKAARERASRIGIDATLCGMCIFVCPWTKKYLNGTIGSRL